MAQRTTVRLPPDLMRRAKRKAAAEGRSLTALIEDGVRRVVADNRREEIEVLRLPRVSAATGGPASGVDLDDNASLQGREDFEYIRRLP